VEEIENFFIMMLLQNFKLHLSKLPSSLFLRLCLGLSFDELKREDQKLVDFVKILSMKSFLGSNSETEATVSCSNGFKDSGYQFY
jgi:hypothetical protein